MKKIVLAALLSAVSVFGANHIIDQRGKTFIPHEITAHVGDTITFKNSDPFAHNAYTDNEANEFDIGMQASGTKKSIKVTGKEDFYIECAIHPDMLIKVKVQK